MSTVFAEIIIQKIINKIASKHSQSIYNLNVDLINLSRKTHGLSESIFKKTGSHYILSIRNPFSKVSFYDYF